MFIDKTRTLTLNRILLSACKLPIISLILGAGCLVLSYIDDFFPRINSKYFFATAETAGNILVILALVAFFYNSCVLICKYYEDKLHAQHHVASLVLSSLRGGLRIIFILVLINIILTLCNPTEFYLLFAKDIIKVIIISALGWVAIQIIYTFEAVIYQSMLKMSQQKDNYRLKDIYTKMHILRNIATVIIVLLTVAAILMSFSSVRNIGISLLASAGFFTAIVGLAAQKGLSSIFAGLQIALSQRIKIGDIVMIENTSGMIEEISFTYVIIKLSDRRRLVVPITSFIDKSFENWSREPDSLRSSLSIFVDYTLPIEPLRQELQQILQASSLWDGQIYNLQVANITERSVELRIGVSALNADRLSNLQAEVREKMLKFIREKFPHHFPKMRIGDHSITANAEE